MMKHRIQTLAISGLLLSIWITAVTATEPQVIKLDDAITQAVEKNSEIIPAKLDVELAKIELQSTEANSVLTPNPSQLRQRRLALQSAEDNYATQKINVTREVRSQAFDLLKAEDTLALNQRKLQQAIADRDTTKLKVELNIESAVSLLTADKNVIAAQQTVDNSAASLEIARMNFLNYIGVEDIKQQFKLEIPDFELTLETWEENKALEQALSNTAKIVTARHNLEAAELDMKLNNSGFTPSTDRRKYEIALEKARLALAVETKGVLVQVHQYIADINSLHKELSAAEIAVKIAEEQLAATKIKHQQGMITDAQLATQENSLIQAQQSLLDTKFRVRDKQQDFSDYLDV